MQGALRLAALGVMTLGLALWFFGGMNLGRTRTEARQPTPDTPAGAAASGADFRPGVDFLGICGGLTLGLWLASRRPATRPAGLG